MTARTVTVGDRTLRLDGEPVREDDSHGVFYRVDGLVLRCEKLVIYGGEVPIPKPEWTLGPEGDGDAWWSMFPEDATVDRIIGAGERKAAAAFVRRTKSNPEA